MPQNDTEFNLEPFDTTELAPPSTLMEAVVRALRSNLTFAGQFSDGGTDATSKVFADTVAQTPALPYVLYTEPEDKPLRVFSGEAIGQGEFEIGVFAARKDDCRRLLYLVRAIVHKMLALNPADAAANAKSTTMDVGEGVLTFLRNVDNKSRSISTPAPATPATAGQPPQTPLEFGRAMTFKFIITRSDP